MREYPAYGRTLASHIVRGQKPMAIAVLLSTGWRYFDHVPKVCIRPEDWERSRYELSWLQGLHVVAVPGDDCTEPLLAELLVELMRVGPRELWAFDASGKLLYDGDSPFELAHWARELAATAGVTSTLSWAAISAARMVMTEAQLRAAKQWQREYARIERRGDAEASARFSLRDFQIKDQVRELFRTPFRDSDARAA
jgi:hypothetical protein